MQDRTNSAIVADYRTVTGRSAELAREAAQYFPAGVTHDGRVLDPYGIYVERARGAHKWDADGNRYIDYFGGHGALLLGHGLPEVTAAVEAALADGTHFGANHRREVEWAAAIRRLVPSIERLRFTSSGTEATMMAVRLARAFTGRSTIVRLKGHFHGWQDHAASGFANHFDGTPAAGIVQGITEKTKLLEPGLLDEANAVIASDPDIAALMMEPTGASFGIVPLNPSYVAGLREITARHDVLLIFDEVVTGFRCAPGGAQELLGVEPDISAYAKILAGGLPGGAVAGRADILNILDQAVMNRRGKEKVSHPGTFNANPLSAAAGTACLGIIARTDATERASALAAKLRNGFNEVLARQGLAWSVYGQTSGFHLFTNPAGRDIDPLAFQPLGIPRQELSTPFDARAVGRLRLAMLVRGVDLNPRLGGLLSAAHSDADLEETVRAFGEALAAGRSEGLLPQ